MLLLLTKNMLFVDYVLHLKLLNIVVFFKCLLKWRVIEKNHVPELIWTGSILLCKKSDKSREHLFFLLKIIHKCI